MSWSYRGEDFLGKSHCDLHLQQKQGQVLKNVTVALCYVKPSYSPQEENLVQGI